MTIASTQRRHWTSATTQWMAWLTAGGAPRTTLELRAYQLTRIGREIPIHPWDVTDRDLAAWLADHDWSLETRRSYRAALRSFYGWAHASGLISVDPARLLRKVPAAQARPRPASERSISEALGRADDRQALALILGAHHGLRRGEIAVIHTDDLVEDSDGGWSLIVHGKGRKDRLVPLLDGTAQAIRAAPAGWLFPNGRGSHLTPAHVGVIIRRCFDGGTPHQLRHRFASRAYQSTRDIRAVQELLGHASVATTQRYTAVADGALRRVLKAAS